MLSTLKHVVEDVAGFGVHSLRSGGATAAANAGVSDRHSRDMDAGSLRQLRMVTSKILWRLDCKCHKSLVCNPSYILCYLQAFIWAPYWVVCILARSLIFSGVVLATPGGKAKQRIKHVCMGEVS